MSRTAPVTTDEAVLDRLLDGAWADPDGEECRNGGLDMVAALLVRVAGPATPDETVGLAAATAMFREEVGPVGALGGGPPLTDTARGTAGRGGARSAAARSLGRFPRWRLLAAGAAASTVFGGMAAAYAGALPAALQTVAHDVIGAPAPQHAPTSATRRQEPATHRANQQSGSGATQPGGGTGPAGHHAAAGGSQSPTAGQHGHRHGADPGHGQSPASGSQPSKGHGHGHGRNGAPGQTHGTHGRGTGKNRHSGGGGNPGHQHRHHHSPPGHGKGHGHGSGTGNGQATGHGHHGK